MQGFPKVLGAVLPALRGGGWALQNVMEEGLSQYMGEHEGGGGA